MTVNSVYNSKRNGGRCTVYFEPDLKNWLKLQATEDGRSLSSMVDKICIEYAKEHGYEEVSPQAELVVPQEPTSQMELTSQEPTLQTNPLDINQINKMAQEIGQHLATSLVQIINGATKCLMF